MRSSEESEEHQYNYSLFSFLFFFTELPPFYPLYSTPAVTLRRYLFLGLISILSLSLSYRAIPPYAPFPLFFPPPHLQSPTSFLPSRSLDFAED